VLVRSITTRESEWTPDEVAALLASRILEKDMGPHGHPMSEATSPLAAPGSKNQKWRYVGSPLPVQDHAAKALADAQDAYKNQWGKDRPLPAGLHFSVDRVDLE
jgi:hypothetical protein